MQLVGGTGLFRAVLLGLWALAHLSLEGKHGYYCDPEVSAKRWNNFPNIRRLGFKTRCASVQNTALGAVVWGGRDRDRSQANPACFRLTDPQGK